MAVLGAAPERDDHAPAGATLLSGGFSLHPRLAMGRAHAKDGLGRAEPVLIQIGTAGFCRCDGKAARRSGMGVFQEPSRFPKGPEARFSYGGGSGEGR